MMLGLVRPGGRAGDIFARAWANSPRSGRATQHVEDAGGRYRVGLSRRGGPNPPAPEPDAPVTVLLHGDVYNEADLRRQLGVASGSAEALVAALYERDGLSGLRPLDGAFVVAIVDRRTERLHVATDPFGSRPLYCHAGLAGLTFASGLTALIAALDDRPALSMRAVADFVTLGFVLGRKTLAADLDLLEPGTVLTCCWTTGATTRERYFDPIDLFTAPHPAQGQYLELVGEAFQQAVRKTSRGTPALGLSLSGGLDSRAILSATDGLAEQLLTYTVGVPGCADQSVAAQLSRIAGTRHRFFPLDERYLRDFLPRQTTLVELTDGLYLSHGLTEMLVLEFLEETGIRVLLRGHGGELAKTSLAWPLHTDERVYGMPDRSGFVDYLAGRANHVTPNIRLADLFTAAAARLGGEGAVASMRELLDPVPLSPPELCSYLYLTEHYPRFTVPSLELFRTQVDVRLPFMDRDFLRVLLSAPPAWRDDTTVHRALTRAGNPALLRVRNANTGARGDAGPLAEMVLDKVNSALKRLNVPGYRHYHAFDDWLRKELLGGVEHLLLGPDARTSIFLSPIAASRLIKETRAGTHDHAHLLQVLLIIELWLRQHQIERIDA